MVAEGETIWDKLENIDRRILYLLIWIVVLPPLISPIGLPISISPSTVAYYEAIEKLPPGSMVVVSFDFGLSALGELYPIAVATFHHLFSRPVKFAIIATWNEGPIVAKMIIDKLNPEQTYHKVYGEDWIFLGWAPGGEQAMAALGRDIWGTITKDYIYKKPVSQYPIMQHLKSAKDVDILISLETGTPGADEWVRQWWEPYHVPMLVACIGVMAPTVAPYVQAGQCLGLLPGLRAGAEYEKLLGRPELATAAADAISTSHILVLAFVIIGNIGYFAKRRRRME
ncbi:MAG: hypothetical protein DRJ30_01650 [Candidatus Methanomethylicota archaeon]|nr:MAG: hypothetical protein DRJ30_01650 [Candidatus Verstraetearchaeota archaeon]